MPHPTCPASSPRRRSPSRRRRRRSCRRRWHPSDAWGLTPWDRGRCRERSRAAQRGHLHAAELAGHAHDPRQRRRLELGQHRVRSDAAPGAAQHHEPRVRGAPDPARRFRREKSAGQRPLGCASSRRSPVRPMGWPRAAAVAARLPCTPPPWGTFPAVRSTTGKSAGRCRSAAYHDRSVAAPRFDGAAEPGRPARHRGRPGLHRRGDGRLLRAFDVETGNELWSDRCPPAATPRR